MREGPSWSPLYRGKNWGPERGAVLSRVTQIVNRGTEPRFEWDQGSLPLEGQGWDQNTWKTVSPLRQICAGDLRAEGNMAIIRQQGQQEKQGNGSEDQQKQTFGAQVAYYRAQVIKQNKNVYSQGLHKWQIDTVTRDYIKWHNRFENLTDLLK